MTDQTTGINRRDVLKAGAATGVGAMLGANTPRAALGAQEDATQPAVIEIPESITELPTDDVTFRWVDSGDLKAVFYSQYFEAYQEAHPNITIQYDQLPWEEIQQIVPLGVRNGNAHDVFQIPLNIQAAQVVQEGWVTPLNDVIPNFAEWEASLPFGTIIPGVHSFNGQTYTFPISSSKRYSTLWLHNTALVQEAGYDPMETPLTWDSFRDAARIITENGEGEYYGVLLWGQSSGRFADFVRNLGRYAGASASNAAPIADMDWRTGEYVFTSDAYMAAIELLLALRDDGSVFPGSTSLIEAEARSLFPQGVAGFLPEGPWSINQWRMQAPEFDFGVAGLPMSDTGTTVPITIEETGANQVWVFSDSPYKNITADMLHYISSLEGQTALVAATGGNLLSFRPEANAAAQSAYELDPMASRAISIFEDEIRLGPMPVIRNPDVLEVYLNLQTPTPNFGEVLQGIYTGQLDDPRQAMEDTKSGYEQELDRAIAQAQENGAEVSRDDFVFSNWDPTRDFTEKDYGTS